MSPKDSETLILKIHSDFFKQNLQRDVPDEERFYEMLLNLEEFDPLIYYKDFGPNVSFGQYDGSLETMRQIVGEVDPNWPKYFDGREPIFCGFVQSVPVCFCMIADYGRHEIGGKQLRVGGPGCVGTLPQFRERGLGLTMVTMVTQMLKSQGYAYAHIHYTSEPQWYAKLGYKTYLKW